MENNAYTVLDGLVHDSVFSVHGETAKGAITGSPDLLRASESATGPGTAAEAPLSTAFSVEQALNSYVAALEEPRPPDGKWHPSSLFGCPRKAVYEVRGREVTDPVDERGKRVFRVGHLFHGFIQDAVEQFGGSVTAAYREIPIADPELNVCGHADGLVQFESGVWELQEFKSIKSTGFKFGGLPKAEHVGQTTAYLHALRKYGSPDLDIPPLGDDLTRARITYVSKDDMAISEHSVFWSEAKDDNFVLKIGDLEQYREGYRLPPRMPTDKGNPPKYPCGYCSFRQRCWELDSTTEEAH